MRYIEWAVMFIVAGLGIALANFVGFQVSFVDSLPGIAILLLISLASVGISKIVPFKAGMENADYCSTCYDWNFYIFCNYCTGWLVPDWCDLREKGIVWRIF